MNGQSTLFRVAFVAWLVITLAYALVFTLTARSSGADSLITALINTLPLMLLGVGVATRTPICESFGCTE